MRISDWSSDVCSSDLDAGLARGHGGAGACVAAILARRRHRAARAAGGPQPRWPRRHVFTSPRARRPAMSSILPSCCAALLAALARFPSAADAQVEIAVVDRDAGRWRPPSRPRGDRWLAGGPGPRSPVPLTTTTRRRVLVV